MGPLPPVSDGRSIRRRLRRLTTLAPGAVTGTRVFVAVGACATVAMMLILGRVIDQLLFRSATPRDLRVELVWLAAVGLVRAGCAGACEWCGQLLAARVKAHVRLTLVDAIVARGSRTGGHVADRTGEMVADIVDGVERLDAYYRRYLPQVFAVGLVPVVVLIAVAWLDVTSAVVLAVTGPLVLVFMWLIGGSADARSRVQWQTLRRLAGELLEVLGGLPTSIVFGQAPDAIDRLDRSSETYRVATMSVLRVAFLSGLVLELAATVSMALVAVGVGIRLIEGWIAFRPALSVLLLTPEFYAPLRQLGQRHHAGMEGVAAAERVFAWIDSAADTEGASVEGQSLGYERGGDGSGRDEHASCLITPITVRFDRVSFRYRDSTRPAVEDVDLELLPGGVTAIVGPTGAGKSTLAALLLRFVEPSSGVIRANGCAIGDLDAAAWRHAVAFVPQAPHFFDGTVLDTLRFGRPDAPFDDVREAARLAEADTFVGRLPKGYDTRLGEMAAEMSAGERQRLALARALVKDAPLLVLDEPTSSLDPVTEAAIARVVTSLARDRTVLVIAHRLNTVRRADRLIVLDTGRVVAVGRHDQLVERGGVYARLVAVATELETVS